MSYPKIIQGGMGLGVSSWKLAKEVASAGHLGVVAGSAMDVILVRRLQKGDPEGDMRRALSHFPDKRIAERILTEYFVEGGIKEQYRFKQIPMYSADPPKKLTELTVAANFVEVFLAKEGHDGLVGINLLEKIQLPNLASIYGAMLAGVDYVIMGAGIPLEIPGIMDRFARKEAASIKLNVEGAQADDDFTIRFDPQALLGEHCPLLKRPKFLPIVSSNILAMTMVKKASGRVDGLIIEGYLAGGHNAPPRGPRTLSAQGEPVYGAKDNVDTEKLKSLNVPFWLAGDYGDAKKYQEARALGAAGIQVGTPFEFCEESGLADEFKKKLINAIKNGIGKVFTDPFASPTGFPFKVLSFIESVSDKFQFLSRPRICDLGYLRHLFRKENGTIGYRCPAEPKKQFVAKGGDPQASLGRKCLCNALLANIELPKLQLSGYLEKPLITAGACLKTIKKLLDQGKPSYTARDVINLILSLKPA